VDLRSEPLPQPVPETRLRALRRELERIEDLLQYGERVTAEAAIAACNRDTGHDYGP
jgi:hypothetical protein